MNIERYHNIIPLELSALIKEIVWRSGFGMECSNLESEFSFFSRDLEETEKIVLWDILNIYFYQYTIKYKIDPLTLKPNRIYVNCHPAYHPGDWHTDSSEPAITMIYYPDIDIDYVNEGGLEIENHGIEPYIANSLLIIPSNIRHRTQMHTLIGKMRFSIAIKFLLIQ